MKNFGVVVPLITTPLMFIALYLMLYVMSTQIDEIRQTQVMMLKSSVVEGDAFIDMYKRVCELLEKINEILGHVRKPL